MENEVTDTVLIGGVMINLYETLKLADAMGFTYAELIDYLQVKKLPPHLIKNLGIEYMLFFNKTPI